MTTVPDSALETPWPLPGSAEFRGTVTPRVVLLCPEPSESPWLPIETAPKDCNILLTDGVKVSEGGWVSDMDQGAEWEGQIGMADWWSVSLSGSPVAWMPLPPPPQGESK